MKRTVFIGAAGALALSAVATPAAAQTNADQQTGVRSGDVLLRVRAIMVAPNERSGSVLPAFPGEKVRVDNSFMPEVDATYMASDHVGFELIASLRLLQYDQVAAIMLCILAAVTLVDALGGALRRRLK